MVAYVKEVYFDHERDCFEVYDRRIGSTDAISWGEPALITQVMFDRECPRCNLTQKDGFDLGIADGKVFGCKCPRCDFSFGIEEPEIKIRKRHRRGRKRYSGKKCRRTDAHNAPYT